MAQRRLPSSTSLGVKVALLGLAWATPVLAADICDTYFTVDDDEGSIEICEKGGGGLVIYPVPGLPPIGAMPIYLIGMVWCFMGVGIIADVFMGAIEVITSKETEVKLPDGTKSTAKVWNATVANLTLMALGSSAPEIILSVIETVGGGMYSGDLGPSTIVGSAAFNLLCIIAVCVIAIPPGDDPANPDGRLIADLGVFAVTATFSVFAYVWLIIILLLPPTVDTVSFYEGLLTFLFFPAVVIGAYGADQGWWSKNKVAPFSEKFLSVEGGKGFSQQEACSILQKLDGTDMTNEEKAEILAAMRNKPSRAQLRMQATRMMTGGKRVVAPPPNPKTLAKFQAQAAGKPHFFFGDAHGLACTAYSVLESNDLTVHVMRSVTAGECTVKYKTEEIKGPHGAKPGDDYVHTEGTLTFADGESTKDVTVQILNDEAVEEDEHLKFVIYDCSMPNAHLENGGVADVTIVDDDEPGELGFDPSNLEQIVKESSKVLKLKIKRSNGSAGKLTAKYRCVVEGLRTPCGKEARPAQDGVDFAAVSGELVFLQGELNKTLAIEILDDKVPAPKTVKFDVVLSDVQALNADGAAIERVVALLEDNAVAQVTIVNDENTQAILELALKKAAENDEKYAVGTESWGDQFRNAFEVEADEGEAVTTTTLVLHYITLPWKLAFAIVPPTKYGGGWVCFCCALLMIGAVTALIGDLAGLFGCSLGLPGSVTAITFVALGTSLPDTFASKAAALSDETADAAVGNVTGSNAVNVFLGLGMPWLIASAFWDFGSHSDEAKIEWGERYCTKSDALKDMLTEGVKDWDKFQPGFAVPAGALGPSVGIFCVCACICIGALVYRRKVYGMELGGDSKAANRHALFFVFLWFVYIGGSIILEATS